MAMRHSDFMRRFSPPYNAAINGEVVESEGGNEGEAAATSGPINFEAGGELPTKYCESRRVDVGRPSTCHSKDDASTSKQFDKGVQPSRSTTPLADGEWMAFDREGIRTSNVNVIDDDPSQLPTPCAEHSINITATLFRCRRLILRPFLFLLRLIAWQPFSYRFQNTGSGLLMRNYFFLRNGFMAAMNVLYPIIIVAVLLYSYVYEALACHGKLSIPTKSNTSSHGDNVIQKRDGNEFTIKGAVDVDPFTNDSSPRVVLTRCPHVVTTYVLPSLLHLAVFLMGFYHFRLQNHESFFSLLEKVFLETAPFFSSTFSQKKIIRRLRLFFCIGLLWVLTTVIHDFLFILAFGLSYPGNTLQHLFYILFHDHDRHHAPSNSFDRNHYAIFMRWLPWGLDVVGGFVQSAVYVVVVLDYVTECEIIRFSVQGLETRLRERSVSLERAFKDVLDLREKINALNGVVGRMASLAVVSFAGGTIVGLCLVFLSKTMNFLIWLYRTLFVAIWLTSFLAPLVQAARLNGSLSHVESLALESRGFGYPGASTAELDSFLAFTSHRPIQARICHVPVTSPPIVVVILAAAAATLLVIQLNVVVGANNSF